MIGLVIVSHSEMIAVGLKELADGMNQKGNAKINAAGGADEGRIGTNTIKIIEAIEDMSEVSQVLIMVDLGSAVLSAETAIDMLDDETKEKVRILDAPLIEATIAIVRMAQEFDDIEVIISRAMETVKSNKI